VPFLYIKILQIKLKNKVVSNKTLVLTLDDGPCNNTLTILKMLAKYDVKATFFILGSCVVGHEKIIEQIYDQGHEICSHGFDHLNHLKRSPFMCLSDITKGWKAIDSALNRENGTYPFRPPYGKLNFISLMYLLIKKIPIVYWTLDSGDRDPKKNHLRVKRIDDIQRVIEQTAKTGGAVLLAHDSARKNPYTETFTGDCIKAEIIMAQKAGIEIMTARQLLNYNKFDL
jgi:peptidoglycan/xylan/chitin deacetylase (PgdA/CDA1 family)